MENIFGNMYLEKSKSPPYGKGQFRVSYNKDGTISLFSLESKSYVDICALTQNRFECDKVAKFELRQPQKMTEDGAVLLLLDKEFIGAYLDICCNEGMAIPYKFVPVQI